MNKNLLVFPAVFLLSLATMLSFSSGPADAAESVYIIIEYNTGTDESFTVTVYGGTGCVSATSPSVCGESISFNSTSGMDEWLNATRQGGSTQDLTNPIIIVTNTGNTGLELNMSVDQDIGTVDSSLDMATVFEQEASCSTTVDTCGSCYDVNTTAITIDDDFTTSDNQWCIWLFGNFSDASAGIDQTTLYFNSTTV